MRASGGEVHYAQDAEEARKIIIDLCKSMDAKSVTKGKSMIAEEIGLNDALEAAGIEPVETDLGEYIIQLRDEAPSHIIAPAIHLTAKDVEQEFRKAHRDLPAERSLAEPEQLLAEARQVLRAKFLAADVGITGANFLVAETGNVDHRHQRGQWRSHANPARGAYRHRLDRKDRPHARRRGAAPARAAALGDRPGRFGLHDALDRAAPAGRSRRPARLSCRHSRQRPLEHARRRVRGHAALHPLRRLHEPLPGLSGGRRTRLWLGLSRADGRGADALADRRRRGRPIAERLDFLRPLRRSVPGPHSACPA